MPRIELSFSTSTVTLILFVIIVGLLAFALYRYTLPPVTRFRRLLLAVLRTAALSLMLLLLFEPLARFVFTSTQPPVVAVLIDNSKSMRIVDRTGNRAEQLAALLHNDHANVVPPATELRAYTFGSQWKAHDLHGKDPLRLDGDATDISSALHALTQERDQYNIQAAILITDGNYNSGPNPVYEAEQLGFPLFTVGLGDSAEQKDLLITKVLANEIVYGEIPTPVDVTVKSSGFGSERAEVTLLEGGKEVHRSGLMLEPGTREYHVQLTYTPEDPGMKKLTVVVSTLPGELTAQNNRRTLYVRVLKSKLRVVLLAGTPGPDVSVIRQTFAEDKNINIRSFTQRVPAGFYEGQLPSPVIDSADCLVLVGFPTAATTDASLEMVRLALVQNLRPVLFIAGRTVDNGRLRAVLPVLPFTPVTGSSLEQYVSAQPSDAQRNNPILAVGSSQGSDAWLRLPPIFKTEFLYRARAEATVLAFTKVQNIVLTDPLVLARNVNRQRSIAVLGYGLWRWRLMTQGDPTTQNLLSSFLANSIRWLTNREDNRPVRVVPSKDSYMQGEPVDLLGQVYDASAQPVDNAQLHIFLRHGESEVETVLRPIGNGRYEASVDGLEEGDYVYRAVARSDGQPFGEDNGKFSIGEVNLEFQDTRMNAALLRELAYRTGGRYLAIAEFKDLGGILRTLPSFTPHELSRTKVIEIWNWQYTLAMIILLLALEWFIRKRSGML